MNSFQPSSYKATGMLSPTVQTGTLLLALSILSGIFLYALYQQQYAKNILQLTNFMQQAVAEKLSQIKETQLNSEKNLYFIAGLSDLSEDVLLGFCRAHDEYDQLRLIDISGQEIIRIHRTPNGCRRVAESQLQNTSSRYYVQEGLKLPKGYSSSSPLDLNVEHGTIFHPPADQKQVRSFNADKYPAINKRREQIALFAPDCTVRT